MSNEDPLTFAMDRGVIWKSALTLLKEASLEFAPGDVTDLAEFLAGDNVPYSMPEMRDSDDESTDSSAESSE